ncbi:Gamma-butyrobetaine dioxygenase, partial [Halocaridina rubra]
QVLWSNGESDIFPYVWLRDNCQCPSCFHPSSKSRIHLIQDLDVNTRPFSAEVDSYGEKVHITWTDGHQSSFNSSWLHPRAFNSKRWNERAPNYKLRRSYWGTNIMKNLPQASFHELLQEDAAVLAWLQQLEVYGFALIKGAPAKPGQVRSLANKIAFIKKTHYGEDFSVIAKNDPSNVAYLNGPLQLHADLPYYLYKPGVQFIHCIVQYAGDGGDTRVSDAVHVARELKRLHPKHYEILINTLVDWFDEGTDETGEFNKVLQLPMICTDATGKIWRINFSQPQRDSFFSLPAEKVAGWYEAMTNYHKLLCDPQYCFQFKMVPGTILTFDNLRIVHGRSGYKTGFSERHIEGCYLDWDEVRSRRRVLETKLGIPPSQGPYLPSYKYQKKKKFSSKQTTPHEHLYQCRSVNFIRRGRLLKHKRSEAPGLRHLLYAALNPGFKMNRMRWLDLVLRSFRIFMEIVSRFIFGIVYHGDPHTPLPPITNLILLDSASTLAMKIRTKKLTSEEVVKSFIARVKEINPILNCVVDNRFEDALKDAKAADNLIRLLHHGKQPGE